jgi:tRNA (guanine10-N2)-dimethyltransferase
MKTIFVVLPIMTVLAGVDQLKEPSLKDRTESIFIHTSGDSPTLSMLELVGAMTATGIQYEIVDISPQVVRIRSSATEDLWKVIARRTGHVIGIYRELFPSKLLTGGIERTIVANGEVHFEDIMKIISTCSGYFCEWLASRKKIGLESIRIQGSFREVSGTIIKKAIGKLITANGGNLHLDVPKNLVAVIISRNIYIGEQLALADREGMRKRRNQFRPFSLPITLSPNLSRVLLNMARVEKQHNILDPFCGTGGILLEAAMMGVGVYGSDLDPKMINGTKENFSFFKLDYRNIEVCDVEDAYNLFPKMDAVITDPPYGRSTSTGGEKMEELYRRMFVSIVKILKNGGRCAMILPSMAHLSDLPDELILESAVSHRVHRSLVRHFVSLIKEG